MRKILLTLIISSLCIVPLMSQDTITSYFNDQWEIVSKKKKAKYFRKEYFDNEKKLWAVNDYYLSGQIQMTGFYETKKKDVKHNVFKYYYDDGQLEKVVNYMRGEKHGKYESFFSGGSPQEIIEFQYGKNHGALNTFWANGQMRRKDVYHKGSFQSGIVWDSLGKQVDYYNYSIMPEFPGGEQSLFSFIAKNVYYPSKAKYKMIQGEVVLEFVVGIDGKISNVKVIKSVHKLIDKEAVRIIKKMPRWKPGSQDGKPVYVRYQLPINFKLE